MPQPTQEQKKPFDGYQSNRAQIEAATHAEYRPQAPAAPATPAAEDDNPWYTWPVRKANEAWNLSKARNEAYDKQMAAEETVFSAQEAGRKFTRSRQENAYNQQPGNFKQDLAAVRASTRAKPANDRSISCLTSVPNPATHTDDQLKEWLNMYNTAYGKSYSLDDLYNGVQQAYENGRKDYRDAREASKRSWINPARLFTGDYDEEMQTELLDAKLRSGMPVQEDGSIRAWDKMLYQARMAGMAGSVNPFSADPRNRMKQVSLGTNTLVEDNLRHREDSDRRGKMYQYVTGKLANGMGSVFGLDNIGDAWIRGVNTWGWGPFYGSPENDYSHDLDKIYSEYEDYAKDRFGVASGANAGQWLRRYGNAAEIGGAALATAATAGAGNALRAAANVPGRMKAAQYALRTAGNVINAGRATQVIGSAIHGVSDEMTENGALDVLQPIKPIVDIGNEWTFRAAPSLALTGGIINPVLNKIPGLSYAAKTVAGGSKLRNGFERARSVASWGLDNLLRMNAYGAIGDLKDFRTPQLEHYLDAESQVRSALGFKGGMIYGLGKDMLKSFTVPGAIAADEMQYDYTTGEKLGTRYDMDLKGLKDLQADKQQSAKYLREYGFNPATATDEDLRSAYAMKVGRDRQRDIDVTAMLTAFPAYMYSDNPDADNELLQKWDALPAKRRGAIKYKLYWEQGLAGGIMPSLMMSDTDLSQKQRKDLFTLAMGKYAKNANDKGIVSLAWDKVTGGGLDTALETATASPYAMDALVSYAGAELRDAVQGKTSVDPSATSGLTSASVAHLMAALPENRRTEIVSTMLYDPDTTGTQVAEFMKKASDAGVKGTGMEKAFTTAVADRAFGGSFGLSGQSAGDFAFGFFSSFKDQLAGGSGLSESDMRALTDMAATVPQGGFYKAIMTMSPEHRNTIVRTAAALKGGTSKLVQGVPAEVRDRILPEVEEGVCDCAIQMVKDDPVANIPLAAGLYLKSRGYDELGGLAQDPLMFYGTLVLMLGGSLLLGKTIIGSGFGNAGEDADAEESKQPAQKPQSGKAKADEAVAWSGGLFDVLQRGSGL